VTNPVERFAELVAARDLDLGEASLVMAAGADPTVDVDEWLRMLDRLAEGVAGLEALRRRLFRELGLRGDTDTYYDPANSLLHRVLQRRRGIPITLAVVTMEVAELGEALAAQGRLREGAQELEGRAESDDLDAETLRAAALALRARLN